MELPPEELPQNYREAIIKQLQEIHGKNAVAEAISEKYGLTSRSGSRESGVNIAPPMRSRNGEAELRRIRERIENYAKFKSENRLKWNVKEYILRIKLIDDLLTDLNTRIQSAEHDMKHTYGSLFRRLEKIAREYELIFLKNQMKRLDFIEKAIRTHNNSKWYKNLNAELDIQKDFLKDPALQKALDRNFRSRFRFLAESQGVTRSGSESRKKIRNDRNRTYRNIYDKLDKYRSTLLNPIIEIVYRTLQTEKKNGSFLHQGGGSDRTRRRQKPTRKNIPVRGFAVVQSTEKPWVKEPNYRRWVAKLRRHTHKVRREGEVEHPDNMCVDSEICKGDLGIPRRLMPQFTSPRDIQSFTRFAETKYGIKSKRSTRKAKQLRPSQEEINRERVEDVADDIRHKKLDPTVPLIVSADNFVIDGHHRWAAYRVDHPKKPMPVLVVDAPARDVLSVAATWGAKHHQF